MDRREEGNDEFCLQQAKERDPEMLCNHAVAS